MKADNVWAMLLVGLHHEARGVFVKECHALAVADQSAQNNVKKDHKTLCADPVSELGLLQEEQVNVQLFHPAQIQPKAAIVAISDVVGPKTENILFFVYPSLPHLASA